jgi:integrase
LRCNHREYKFDRCPFKATPEGLQATVALAKEIEADIYRGRFDKSLKKYGLSRETIVLPVVETPKDMTLIDAWEYYKTLKAHVIAESVKYKKWRYLDKNLAAAPPELLPIPKAVDLILHFRTKYADGTIREWLSTLHAAIQLCIDTDKYDGKNPLTKLKKQKILGTGTKEIKSLTTTDVQAILEAFTSQEKGRGGDFYNPAYFYHLVAFRFLTGCRPSEALPLEWNDITTRPDGKMIVRINKRYTSGVLMAGTKNKSRERVLPCSDALVNLIQSIPRRHDTLLFPSMEGKLLNLDTFTSGYWKPIVERLHREGKISCYIPFYDVRHTFGTHAARSGIDLKTLSAYMGNTPEVLMSHYIEADSNIVTPDYDL